MKLATKFRVIYLLTIFLSGYSTILVSQNLTPELKSKIEKQRTARIMFYNCENMFDYLDDTLKNDEEFLPEGVRTWSKSKYYNKLNQTSKVITAIGGWTPPEIVGLCEIENYKVLHDLTKNSSLYSLNYKIVHKESPDVRGIDVALLYQPKAYQPIENKFITINFSDNPVKHTRDILYSKGILNQTDTIHLFVNHWPSRWGGELESENYRLHVASVLKNQTDSIFESNPYAAIIIMGDFNDEPENNSISTVLNAHKIDHEIVENELYNITTQANFVGSQKYQGNWSILDQFIISGNLLNQKMELKINPQDIVIFNAPFLLEPDENHLGFKPFRTFVGYKYNGGFSDHLPIFIDINRIKN